MIPKPNPLVTQSQPSSSPKQGRAAKTITSQSLFGDAQVIDIHHGVDVYQLRLTKTGKLILTK